MLKRYDRLAGKGMGELQPGTNMKSNLVLQKRYKLHEVVDIILRIASTESTVLLTL